MPQLPRGIGCRQLTKPWLCDTILSKNLLFSCQMSAGWTVSFKGQLDCDLSHSLPLSYWQYLTYRFCRHCSCIAVPCYPRSTQHCHVVQTNACVSSFNGASLKSSCPYWNVWPMLHLQPLSLSALTTVVIIGPASHSHKDLPSYFL